MNAVTRVRTLVAVATLIAAFAIAPLSSFVTNAQGELADPGAGKGAPIVEPNFGGDITTLNPILIQDGSSADVAARLFPAFIGGDPDTGLPTPGARGAIVKEWTVSEDGLTYTFTLRDDWKWSDGAPITSTDVKYAYDAIVSGVVDTTIKSQVAAIESVEAPDPQTVVIKFKELDCAAILVASAIPVVPAHKYKEVYPTFEEMKVDNPYNLAPTVTAGDFKFSNFRPGEQVTLVADQAYVDAILDHVVPEGYVYKQVADQNVGVEQFLAGQITIIDSVPESRQDEMKKLGDEGKLVYNELPAGTRHIWIFNVADPTAPKNGLDENGNPVDQGHHPIFGDKRVRQAVALGINHDDLNKGAFNGHGIAIGTPVLPGTWAHNQNIKAWPYDPERAAALLDEAGWVDDDNNPDTPRVATDKALYAAPGTKLEFKLLVFSGNPSIDASSVLIQNQLKRLGIKMDLDVVEFQQMVGKLLSQTFDANMVFLGISRNNPGTSLLSQHGAQGDVVDSGLNPGSWYNAEFEEVVKKSQTLAGCDQAERKKLLDRAQEILYDEVPMYFVNYSMVPFVAQSNLKNYEPKQFGIRWNIDAWFWDTAQ